MAEMFFQKARARMKKKGTVGSYGHHSMKQINRDIKKGGKIAKKAAFAKAAKKTAAKRRRKSSRK